MIKLAILIVVTCYGLQLSGQDKFPDGKIISDWYGQNESVDIRKLGKKFVITDYGVVNDSTLVQTEKIQSAIDAAYRNGGGVVVIPKGTYLSGALFFKPGTHLYLEEKAILKGSDDISNFPVIETRIGEQSLKYFEALVNADKVDGFTLSGKGTVNVNGERYWKSFWLRRSVIPKCTNMDELRPRLVHVSNSKNIKISDVKLVNSPFWTTHIYKCDSVKLLNLYIYSPSYPVKAPSTDAIDIDACRNILVKGCYLSVNDDAIAMKGGKGPWADQDSNNGGNYDVIIEDCVFGFCHGVLTFGSESIYNHNIILRRCSVNQAKRLLWLKMRPDTPQHYEYILLENIEGNVGHCIYVAPWTQFYDLKDRKDSPKSYSNHITMRNIQLDCHSFFSVKKSDQYELSNFCFDNMIIKAKENVNIEENIIDSLIIKKIEVKKVE